MNKVRDCYCRFIMFLFLRSHTMKVVVRRNGRFHSVAISEIPASIPDGLETIEVAMIPRHRGFANIIQVKP